LLFFCFFTFFHFFRFKFFASLQFSNFRFEAKRGGKLFRFKRSRNTYRPGPLSPRSRELPYRRQPPAGRPRHVPAAATWEPILPTVPNRE
jgi:hypothetical protein